uniref:Diacylglycerol kinase n=1 Tax=Monodelphis domestica TaxID=13616 RepID=F7BA62_MONDO
MLACHLCAFQKSVKEGFLLKQTSSFQRWKRRYVRIRGKTLYYAKDSKSLIFDEIDLTDASVAETSTKNVNNSFTVITPFRKLILCAENRKEMEDWISALKAVQKWAANEVRELRGKLPEAAACSGDQSPIDGINRKIMRWKRGPSGQVAEAVGGWPAAPGRFPVSWGSLAGTGGHLCMAGWEAYQAGSLACSVNCLSVGVSAISSLRLEPSSKPCPMCPYHIHGACRDQFSKKCPLGQYRVSILPPTVLNCMDSDGFWKASCPGSCSSPLLAFVNSKSGDNQGVRFLRKFKQFLNPAQVFDLMNGGPHLGLRLFQRFSTFRILVCGGDGSVGWVLSEIDTLGLHKQCQLGVLPLGTGNDLARVLGWGSLCDDDTQLLQILEKMERATTKMLDRWSVMTWEAPGGTPRNQAWRKGIQEAGPQRNQCLSLVFLWGTFQAQFSLGIRAAWHAVCTHIVHIHILHVYTCSDITHNSIRGRDPLAYVCTPVSNRTDMLIRELEMEPQAAVGYLENTPLAAPSAEEEGDADDFEGGAVGGAPAEVCQPSSLVPPAFRSKDQMVLRANSLKKALKQVIEQAEQGKGSRSGGWDRSEAQVMGVGEIGGKQLHGECRGFSSSHLASLKGRAQRKSARSPKASVRVLPCPLLFSAQALGPGRPGRGREAPCPAVSFTHPRLPFGSESSCPVGTLISILLSSSVDFSQFSEKCVMNNYFGIGLDAKISLEFNNKRDEHPKKCSSRTKNMMWYGVLGTKELLQRTYKNLEQRVQLECDGEIMALPSLQGIAVLNIPSYAGGINFWGGTKEDNLTPQEMDFLTWMGQCSELRIPLTSLSPHCLTCQCRVVKITICGDEGVPVQVDGEAWVQPPGIIKIQHKNRAQMLTRDRAFESTLKSWEDKQKGESYRSARPRLNSQQSMEYLTEEEYRLLQRFARSADILITRIREVAKIHKAIEQELAHSVNSCASSLTEVLPSKRSGSSPESLSRNSAVEVSISVKALYNEARAYVEGKLQLDSPRREEGLQVALANVSQELEKVSEIHWLAPILSAVTEEVSACLNGPQRSSRGSFRLRLNISRGKKNKSHKVKWSSAVSVDKWGPEEVASWLDALGLGEYKDIFTRHEIQGSELILLERRDLKDLGIRKVGHVKKILQGIKDISHNL